MSLEIFTWLFTVSFALIFGGLGVFLLILSKRGAPKKYDVQVRAECCKVVKRRDFTGSTLTGGRPSGFCEKPIFRYYYNGSEHYAEVLHWDGDCEVKVGEVIDIWVKSSEINDALTSCWYYKQGQKTLAGGMGWVFIVVGIFSVFIPVLLETVGVI